MEVTEPSLISRGQAVLNIEAKAIATLAKQIDESFAKAIETILASKGRVIVIGMGKSGHIGNKIAATLASTGTPAFFVHPGEASHGDLGMITRHDVVIALSYSGQTDEMVALLPPLKRFGIPIIAMTGNPKSRLALSAEVHLNVAVEQEACSLGLAPTTSTTVMLALGDALAMALLDVRGFSKEDFAFSHPGGSLGRRLLLTVEDIMHTGKACPTVGPDVTLKEALIEITKARLGFTAIVDDKNMVLGIFTDGDLRRTLEQNTSLDTPISLRMTKQFKSISKQTLAGEALRIMETSKINAILVTEDGKLVGAFNMHDLLRAGVI